MYGPRDVRFEEVPECSRLSRRERRGRGANQETDQEHRCGCRTGMRRHPGVDDPGDTMRAARFSTCNCRSRMSPKATAPWMNAARSRRCFVYKDDRAGVGQNPDIRELRQDLYLPPVQKPRRRVRCALRTQATQTSLRHSSRMSDSIPTKPYSYPRSTIRYSGYCVSFLWRAPADTSARSR